LKDGGILRVSVAGDVGDRDAGEADRCGGPGVSRENVEVARRLWEGFVEAGASRSARIAISDSAWDPGLEYLEDPRWPGSGTYRGLRAIEARFAEYLEVFGAVEITVRELVDAGDHVVSVFHTRGESAQTGLPFEHEWAYVWRFRDGRVIEWRAYFEAGEALEAVGLSE
jgi:ketosteroid isomerase-like protein